MYAKVDEKKDNKSRVAANTVVQKKSGVKKGFEFVNSRYENDAQNRIPKMAYNNISNMQLKADKEVVGNIPRIGQSAQIQPIVQLNKNIHNKIYYGTTEQRGAYMERDNAPDNVHTTVDSLNRAIGLSSDTMGGAALPMGGKREVVNEAISNRDGDNNLTEDEKAWAKWLSKNKKALLMPEMTGAQCRNDMSMDDSWLRQKWAQLFPPTRHKIDDGGNGGWTQEDHSVNLDKEQRPKMNWTSTQRTAHDNYVDAGRGEANNAYLALKHVMENATENNMFNQVMDRTEIWLGKEVMHRFWRLTSLMGLDFFVAKGKQVDFVRADDVHEVVDGPRSITDSEWQHAQDRGYINNGVTKINPV